ncbi:MAG: helix-turn-helix domain-containing protein, partial [Candidatus Latescibacteria bacterium]|nr:helix-turn-helix domain-containing protein [Candidatus Latescibacterota bacterium]
MPETRLTFAEMPELMTPQQVESLLQISSSTFFRWAKAGQLPGAIKIGDSWRVVRDQLKDHFDQAAHTPNQPEGTGTM